MTCFLVVWCIGGVGLWWLWGITGLVWGMWIALAVAWWVSWLAVEKLFEQLVAQHTTVLAAITALADQVSRRE